VTLVVTPHKDSGSPQVALSRHWEWYVGDHTPDHILSGFTLSTVASLNLPVAAGEGYVSGYHVEDISAGTVTVTDAATNHIYIQLTRSGSDVTGASLVANTTGTAPTDSIKLGTATASGGQVTAITDARPLRSDIKAYPIAKVSSAPADSPDKELTNIYVKQDDANNNGLYAKIKRNNVVAEMPLLTGVMVAINLDETNGIDVTESTTEQVSKTYTLPANNYSKIIVHAVCDIHLETQGGGPDDMDVEIHIGSTVKTYKYRVDIEGTDDVFTDTHEQIMASAVQTASATIKVVIKADAGAIGNLRMQVKSFHVYGVI